MDLISSTDRAPKRIHICVCNVANANTASSVRATTGSVYPQARSQVCRPLICYQCNTTGHVRRQLSGSAASVRQLRVSRFLAHVAVVAQSAVEN